MRKYQQLLLVILSVLSFTIVYIYKSENDKLKYVLRVVNFFGRNDAAVLHRLENYTRDEVDFSRPLPVWQRIGGSFYAYAAYWNRNELVAGGEVVSIVTGDRGAIVNFRCSILYDGGAHTVQGKFRFQRIDNEHEDVNSEFTIYSFACRLTRDFGHPESVIFTDLSSNKRTPHKLRLRHIKSVKDKTVSASPIPTVCLDLVGFNMSSSYAKQDNHLLQFFLHHHVLGIEHFIIYDGDELPQRILRLLQKSSINFHRLPFNFPYSRTNSTARLRRIIELDCLMRNVNFVRHTLLLAPNEFFYPNGKLTEQQSVLRSLHHYTAEVMRFEIATFGVCMDHNHKLLADNTLHDPEVKSSHRIYVYRPHVPISTVTDTAVSSAGGSNSVALPLSTALAHRYVSCLNVGKDGLHDWRNTLREDFMQHIQLVRNEVDVLI